MDMRFNWQPINELYRIDQLQEGDQNTCFFHVSAISTETMQ